MGHYKGQSTAECTREQGFTKQPQRKNSPSPKPVPTKLYEELGENRIQNKGGTRQVFVPKETEHGNGEVKKDWANFKYSFEELVSLNELAKKLFTVKNTKPDSAHQEQLSFVDAVIEEGVEGDCRYLVYTEQHLPGVYNPDNIIQKNMDLCSFSKKLIACQDSSKLPLVYELILGCLNPSVTINDIIALMNQIEPNTYISTILTQISTDAEFKQIMTMFVKAYREFFFNTGYFLDMQGHHNVALHVCVRDGDKFDGRIVVNNSAIKSFSNFSKYSNEFSAKYTIEFEDLSSHFLTSICIANLYSKVTDQRLLFDLDRNLIDLIINSSPLWEYRFDKA